MNIRNRVKEMREVRVGDLKPNPKNWRTHPQGQKDALKGLLAEVGFAVPAIARLLPDGSLMLLDGHLRTETMAPDSTIPVCVLDVTEEEADKLLVTIDPLSGLAGQNDAKLAELLAGVQSDSAAVQAMLGDLYKLPVEKTGVDESAALPGKFEILIECSDEQQQAELLEKFAQEGLTCRSLIS